NLVKIDVEGNAVGKADYGVNPAGFIIHSAIHSHLDNAHWVMHTHTREGVAVSVKEHGLTNTNFYSAMLGDHVAYHDFEGLTVRTDECERLVKSIGDKPLIILRNHGLLTHGRSAEECFRRLWVLQQACETQVLSESMAGPDRQVTPEATENSTRDGRLFNSNDEMGGGLMFEALQRIIEVRDPTYRH
ncbi:MAG: class II aldolase/adducin family protein, partial [Chromatiales bacterium]|nr:class II aldolase/adducin family protein [Chromatiales bacterium]